MTKKKKKVSIAEQINFGGNYRPIKKTKKKKKTKKGKEMSEKDIKIKATGVQSDKKEDTSEKKWNDIVSDYKTPEELATAYKTLKAKDKVALSDKDEEFYTQTKAFFGDTAYRRF